MCLLRLGVRTRGFHPRNGGSIPPGDVNKKKRPNGLFFLFIMLTLWGIEPKRF